MRVIKGRTYRVLNLASSARDASGSTSPVEATTLVVLGDGASGAGGGAGCGKYSARSGDYGSRGSSGRGRGRGNLSGNLRSGGNLGLRGRGRSGHCWGSDRRGCIRSAD